MWDGLWQRESGKVNEDAAYILALPTLKARQRELRRLGLVHGDGHRWNVDRAVRENWPEVDGKLPPLPIEHHANPRRAALEAARKY